MNNRTALLLARSAFALYLLLAGATLFMQWVNAPSTFLGSLFNVLVLFVFITVGALVASRRPTNPIGWLFCGGTLLWAAGVLALEYAVYALITAHGSLPAGAWLAWFGSWVRGLGFFLIVTYLLLLFPNGQLPSPRWRFAAWLSVLNLVFFTLWLALSPEQNDLRLPFVGNPFNMGVDPIVAEIVTLLAITFLPTTAATCAAAVIYRFRRARRDERQQLKWLAFALLPALFFLMVALLVPLLELSALEKIGSLLYALSVAPIPIAVGIAILRYRLYDIDLLIRRTLIYAALTAMLALIYWGGVVGLQALLRPITGPGNDLSIVASTLLIAALFLPLRQRIQAYVDRRFYRRKYDAAKTLATFSQTVRDEVELDKLTGRLVEVVEETMQPAHVSLWLRGPERKKAQRVGE